MERYNCSLNRVWGCGKLSDVHTYSLDAFPLFLQIHPLPSSTLLWTPGSSPVWTTSTCFLVLWFLFWFNQCGPPEGD